MLGYDLYYLACEGRVVAVVAESDAAAALVAWRELPDGKDAAQIGYLQSGPSAGCIAYASGWHTYTG
jgi:hydrogenase expression/formation protein HypE